MSKATRHLAAASLLLVVAALAAAWPGSAAGQDNLPSLPYGWTWHEHQTRQGPTIYLPVPPGLSVTYDEVTANDDNPSGDSWTITLEAGTIGAFISLTYAPHGYVEASRSHAASALTGALALADASELPDVSIDGNPWSHWGGAGSHTLLGKILTEALDMYVVVSVGSPDQGEASAGYEATALTIARNITVSGGTGAGPGWGPPAGMEAVYISVTPDFMYATDMLWGAGIGMYFDSEEISAGIGMAYYYDQTTKGGGYLPLCMSTRLWIVRLQLGWDLVEMMMPPEDGNMGDNYAIETTAILEPFSWLNLGLGWVFSHGDDLPSGLRLSAGLEFRLLEAE